MSAKEYKLYKSDPVINKTLQGFPPLLRILLARRGIFDVGTAKKFTEPQYANLSSPLLLQDIDKAVERIIYAIEHEELIVVFADFDVDGISSALVMRDFFVMIGYTNFEVYLPHRHNEGYGITIEPIDGFKEKGVSLIITVDVGITAFEAVEYARELGIDVIVTDHHEPKEILPNANVVINPKLGSYPDPMLCGAGVAFQVVRALLMHIRHRDNWKLTIPKEGEEKWILDVVGMATISDMVPLLNDNRIMAYFGLKVMHKTRRKGLEEFMRRVGVHQPTLTEDDIGFMLAPRINAASRMSHPEDAYLALSSDSPSEIAVRIEHLESINTKRKTEVSVTMREVHKRLKGRPLNSVIVIGDPSWNIGLVGLLANKIAEEYNRPTFVWSRFDDQVIKGSFRTNDIIHGLDFLELVPPDTFLGYGGHGAAGGFSISSSSIHTLEEVLSEICDKVLREQTEKKTESVTIDAKLLLSDVTPVTKTIIDMCAPFGTANPKPVFLFENVTIESIRQFGKAKDHLEVYLSEERKKVKAIDFFRTVEDLSYLPKEGEQVDVIGTLETSTFMGKTELRLRLLDIFKAGENDFN